MASQNHDSKTTTLRPFEKWTIAYCRRCFAEGLMTIEQLQTFMDVFRDGVTLAELMEPLDDPRPIDHKR